MRGNYPQAMERYQQSLKIAEGIDHRLGMARALNNLGNVHDAQGNYTEAARLYQQSLKIGRISATGPPWPVPWANLGNIHEQWGDYTLALGIIRRVSRSKRDRRSGWLP